MVGNMSWRDARFTGRERSLMKALPIVALCCAGLFLSFTTPFPGKPAKEATASSKRNW